MTERKTTLIRRLRVKVGTWLMRAGGFIALGRGQTTVTFIPPRQEKP